MRSIKDPILKSNQCSIYEVRPLACRLQYSLADDDKPCVIGNLEAKVPYLNMSDRKAAGVLVLGPDMVYADIRDWFKNNAHT